MGSKWAHSTCLCTPNSPKVSLEKHIFDPFLADFWSAYVDDVSVPVPRGAGPRIAATVQQGLALIGCHLNVTKSEALPLSLSSPPPPTLPKYAQPPQPLQAGTDFWTPVPSIEPPEWSDDSQHLLTKVSYLLHLGHPIPAHFHVQAAFRLIENELLSQLADLNAHPSQTLDRVLLVNTVVLYLLNSVLLYRLKYLWKNTFLIHF